MFEPRFEPHISIFPAEVSLSRTLTPYQLCAFCYSAADNVAIE